MGCGGQEQRRTLQVRHRRKSRRDVSIDAMKKKRGGGVSVGYVGLVSDIPWCRQAGLIVERGFSCTRSAKESSSCPIRLLLPLHRATLPSMKSKKSPNGMNASAAHMLPKESGGPRQ